jgi:hypothetical protein
MLGKMLLARKVHEKISRPRARFNDRHEPSGLSGKDGSGKERVWARYGFL